jgi:hypothetical protein
MKKMLKRANGSTSQRGLWDDIRAKAAANKKAGKKGKAPSEDILKAEASVRAKGMGGPGDQGKPAKAASDTTTVPTSEMTKSAIAQLSKNLPASQKMLKAALNKKDTREDKLTVPPIGRNNLNMELRRKKSGGESSWLKESQELNFGGPTPGTTPAPAMSFEEGLKGYMSGKMTASQANAATGYANKPKKYTDAENKENLKKVFSGAHMQDAQGNIVPKVKKTGGKKKMGGKKC